MYNFQIRIVGGEETGINEFPLMAGLVNLETRELYCGASIIATKYAITAAHCLTNRLAQNLALLVGDHNINTGRVLKNLFNVFLTLSIYRFRS